MTLHALYLRAATTKRALDRAKDRMSTISNIVMRRADLGRSFANWKGPSKLILLAIRRRTQEAEIARTTARSAMYYDPNDALTDRVLEGIRQHTLDRKRRVC